MPTPVRGYGAIVSKSLKYVTNLRRTQDLYVHQTETGRPVTDAVVQEICKLRPDMIGISLRDCIEVSSTQYAPQTHLLMKDR